jgi:TP901 family phage tail tape measure protein
MSRIDLHLVGTANFAQVEASIARLKGQIAALNSMSLINPATARNMQSTFANALAASGMYQTRMSNLTSETEKFGRALERGNLRGMQYFRAGSEYLRKQQGQVRALAKEQVRMSQSRAYGFGDGRAVVVTPKGIDEAIHKQQILNQQHRIFRQVVQGGATQLINWGKNTQWAGRQLTVGLTVPLTIFGTVAAKMFMDVDKQLTRMVKVYGDATKGAVDSAQLEKVRSQVSALAQELAGSMGIAAAETAGIAADIAATGAEGEKLLASTREAMRLSVLGEVDRQEAMRATLAIQSVFKKDTQGLTESINLLNAVENQTSTTLNDLVEGIVKAGPVVEGLGGSIEDLAMMMVAMREGGIPAAEAANAIKSSLASLINPTKQTTQVLGDFGINIKEIVDQNAGDVIGTLVALQSAMSNLDDLSRQRSIEQIFGKFQFSRINALLSNIGRAGSQTQQVMEIAGMSTIQLAETAERELTALTESASMKFTRAVEGLKASLIPVGEFFLNIGTFLINGFKGIMDAFNSLAGPLKVFLGGMGIFVALAGPLIMITGVLGNFLGYLVKMAGQMMAVRRGARGIFEYYNAESVAARNLTELLSTEMFDQTKATNTLKSEVDKLTASLATMASQMGAVVSGFGAMGSAATTAAGAARGALVASMGPGSVSRWLIQGGKNANASGFSAGRTFGGPEFSHLVPGSDQRVKAAGIGGVQTIGTLMHQKSLAADYQKVMNKYFAPTQFYDPSQGSRTQVLAQMAAQANRQRAVTITQQPGFEKSAARLLPTREEYNTYVAKYHASLRSLIDLGKVRLQSLSEQISALVTAGNIEGAEKLLISAVQENSKTFDLYYQTELKNISRVEGALDKVVLQAATASLALEQRLNAASPGRGFLPNAGGDSLMRLISATAGGGTASGDPDNYRRPLSPGEQRLVSAQEKKEASIKASIGADKLVTQSTANLSRAQAELGHLQDQYKQYHPNAIRSLQNWTRATDEHGNVTYQNIKTGKILDATSQNLTRAEEQQIAKIYGYLTLMSQLELADKRVADAKLALASANSRHAGQQTRAAAATAELEAAEKALAVETNKARLAMIRQIYKNSTTDVGTGKERAGVTAALKRLEPAILAETASINVLTKDNQKFITLMDSAGQAFAVLNMTTKELIAAEEMLANGFTMSQLTGTKEKFTRERLIQEMTEQALSHNASQSQIDFLTRRINLLSAEVLETMVSFDVTKTALGRLKVVIDGASSRLAAMTTPMGAAGKGTGTAVMGASMAAGMGMMFLPHDGGAGSKIAGGALMGASMGGMMGMMGGHPLAPVAGLLGGAVLGAAIPAIGAMSGSANDARDALTKYSEALNGSSIIIDRFSKELGVLKPSEKLAAEIGQVQTAGTTLAEGQQLLETESGKQLLDIAKQFSGTKLVDALRSQLKQLTLLEIFTPEQAKAVAQRLALELGQPVIGKALVDGINSVLDENGNLISDNVAKIFAETVPEFNFNLPNYTRDNPVTGTQPGGYTPASDEFLKLEQFAKDNIPFIVSSLDKLREAQALTVKEFMDGELTYEQYSEQMSKIREENTKAAEALVVLKNAGVRVTDMIKDIAIAGGIEEEFVNAENAAKDFMNRLSEEMDQSIFGADREKSTFYTQIQVAAAYGDITESEVRALLSLAEDPNQKTTLTTIFASEGAQENAVEIIKLINSGIKPEFIVKIQSNAEEIGTSLNDLYASLVALSKLPDQIQTKITADIMNDPEQLGIFIDNYEYAMSLPDSKKELKAEVFGNEHLEFFERNWDTLLQMPSSQRKTAIFEYMVTGTYNFNPESIPAPTAVTELTSPDASALMSSFDSGGGGGGDSDSANKAIDKRIKQQDKIIEQIQKEREERQKLLDLEKEALNFAMQEQDLKNQIARARAEGNTAEAAMLQAKLDNARSANKEQENERARQEDEDRRIREAERKKKKLEKQKEDSSGGGRGGGGGGMSEEARAIIENSIQFLNDELNSALLNNTKILDNIFAQGAQEGFWKSEPVKRYKEALLDLGIPLKDINTQLGIVYDDLVNKGFTDQGVRQFDSLKESLVEVGISGETLNKVLPDVFGILQNQKLTRSDAMKMVVQAFIDAGDNAEAAKKRAEEFFRVTGENRRFKAIEDFNEMINEFKDEGLDPKQAEIASKKFIEGVRKGATNQQILQSISDSIFEHTFEKGIKRGFSADAAATQAQIAADSIVGKIEENSDRFKVTLVGEYDDTQMPQWLRDEMDARGGNMTADQMARLTVNHDMSGTVKLEMPRGEDMSVPLYVYVTNQQTSGPGDNGGNTRTNPRTGETEYWNGSKWVTVPRAATGGYIVRGTGGMIYGPGGPKDDLIPTMLSNGEYVIRASSVNKYGIPFLDMVNMGMLPALAAGGYSKHPGTISRMFSGGFATSGYNTGGSVSGKESEYNINVYVTESNASADDIASKVMQTLQRRDKMNKAGIRL